MSLCPATGNSGFPVTLQGEIKRAIIPDTSIQTTKFKTSLSVRAVPRTLDTTTGYIDEMTGQDTFLFNTTPYLLQTAQIYDARNNTVILPTNAGAPAFTGQPAFGLALSFTKQQENYAGENALVILIPIFSQATVSNAAEYHVDINAYFADMMSQTPSAARSLGVFLNYESFRASYTTCIELRESAPLNLRVLLFPGYVIQSTTAAQFKSLPPLRIPGALRGFKATAFRRSIDASGAVIVTQWSDEGYCYAGLLSVGDANFAKRVTFYNSTIEPISGPIRPGTENLRTTQQYKCMPLDRLKDVSGNLVLLDPATGTRATLADQLDADEIARQAEVADAIPNDEGRLKAILFKWATIIAVIITIIVVGAIYYFIGQRFHTTEAAIAAVAFANASRMASANASGQVVNSNQNSSSVTVPGSATTAPGSANVPPPPQINQQVQGTPAPAPAPASASANPQRP